MILDTAGAKGTGKWMSQLALDLGVPSTLVTEAVYARCLSAMKDARVRASKVLKGPSAKYDGRPQGVHRADSPGAVRLEDLQLRPRLRAAAGRGRGARLAAELRQHAPCCGAAAASFGPCSSTASRKRSTPTRSWKTCCWRRTSRKAVDKAQDRLAARGGDGRRSWASPCRRSPRRLAYYDGYRRDRLPANLLQAQRDYFGAHTYERIDKPGTFHTDWIRERRKPK